MSTGCAGAKGLGRRAWSTGRVRGAGRRGPSGEGEDSQWLRPGVQRRDRSSRSPLRGDGVEEQVGDGGRGNRKGRALGGARAGRAGVRGRVKEGRSGRVSARATAIRGETSRRPKPWPTLNSVVARTLGPNSTETERTTGPSETLCLGRPTDEERGAYRDVVTR